MKISKDKLLNKTTSHEPEFIEALELLVDDINANKEINMFGIIAFMHQLHNRMNVREKIYKFAENKDMPDPAAPIIVTGLPRSGTTFLFDILCNDTDHRSPLYWEITRPLPWLEKGSWRESLRIFATDAELRFARLVVPMLDAMHKLRALSPEECEQFNTVTAKSVVYIYMSHLPNYKKFLMETDFTNVFEWHKKFFQILELSGRPKNWLFKDPSHIEHIPEILKIYPKARFIHISRDPIKSITSTCSLTEKLWNGLCNQIDRKLIGEQTVQFWENAILKNKEGRTLLDSSTNLDLDYADFIKDPIATMENIYDFIDKPFEESIKIKMESYIKNHKKHKYGKHHYKLKDYGLTEEIIEDRIASKWQIN